jgi:hypothetical protein
MTFLAELEKTRLMYAFLGTGDYTMYPLILPGSFLQIDQSKNSIKTATRWRSEYERPIYFLETRDEYICSWCSQDGNQLLVQPHPLSSVRGRIFKCPQEIEVVGQVVGVAMRLQGALRLEPEQPSGGNGAPSQNAVKLVH